MDGRGPLNRTGRAGFYIVFPEGEVGDQGRSASGFRMRAANGSQSGMNGEKIGFNGASPTTSV
jgi:hypothetical protein